MDNGSTLTNTKDVVATSKDALAALREVAIIVAVVAVLFFPSFVASWAKAISDAAAAKGAKTDIDLGILKLSFESSANQAAALKSTQTSVQDLVRQVSDSKSLSGEQKNRFQQEATTVSAGIQQAIDSAKSVTLAQDRLLQMSAETSTGSGHYGIVVSADKRDDLAAYEVEQLKRRGAPDVVVFDRSGFLRTVSRFLDRKKAEEYLPTVQQYRSTAYLINLDKWCSGTRTNSRSIAGAPVIPCN
jgi:hypothetical protein